MQFDGWWVVLLNEVNMEIFAITVVMIMVVVMIMIIVIMAVIIMMIPVV